MHYFDDSDHPHRGWFRRGFGCWGGRGYGHGYGRGRYISPKNELAALEDEAKILEEELAEIREEIASIKEAVKEQK